LQHEPRVDAFLLMAIGAGRSLREIFDKYLRKEMDDIRRQVQLLQQVGRDLEKEQKRLDDIELCFEETNTRLNEMLSLASQGKIKSVSFAGLAISTIVDIPQPRSSKAQPAKYQPKDFELGTLADGFRLLGELENLREDVEKRSGDYVRGMDDIRSIIDEMFEQRGTDE
jgi:hypothetical protein